MAASAGVGQLGDNSTAMKSATVVATARGHSRKEEHRDTHWPQIRKYADSREGNHSIYGSE
jgi:hypothetical protein